MNVEEIKVGKEKAEALLRAVENYLLAHSAAYN
jgi:hypothetical protein